MTLPNLIDYLSNFRDEPEEQGVLIERLAPILLSRPYLLERAVVEAWPFCEAAITKVCLDHSLEVAKIDGALSENEEKTKR